jgi:hypothetical protein
MRVQLAEDVIWRDLGDEVVILSLANNNYFGLVGAGGQMWRQLAENESTDRAIEALMKEFDTDAATLRTDMQVLVRELESLGLVVVDGDSEKQGAAKAPKVSRSKTLPRRAIKPRAVKPAPARKRASKKGGARKRRSRRTNR